MVVIILRVSKPRCESVFRAFTSWKHPGSATSFPSAHSLALPGSLDRWKWVSKNYDVSERASFDINVHFRANRSVRGALVPRR